MQMNIFRKGFNYAQDGPGNRLVYHLQGCNMRCAWCSNPEGMNPGGTLLVRPEQLLESVCPHGAIRGQTLDRERCAACISRECLHRHRNQGVQWSSGALSVDGMVDEARRSAPLFYDGGGVTLSGGEATVQFKALAILLRGLKEAGVHTALETNGTHPKLPALFPLIDFLIVDFKHHDDVALKSATGVGGRLVRRNLRLALAARDQLLVRIPLVGRFNDSELDAHRFAAFFRPLDTSRARFEFLRYHDYGANKWAQCGMPYRVENGFVSDETLGLFHDVFEANGLDVVTT